MMKKHVAGLTALVMMLGGMTALPAAGEDFDAESAYREILDMYAHHLSTEWKDYIYKDGLYRNKIGGMDNLEIVGDVWFSSYLSNYDPGYRFFDLNGDGVEELLLGVIDDSYMTCITDVYTYYDGQVVHLITMGLDSGFGGGASYYYITSQGYVGFASNANMHAAVPIGTILYKIESGELKPFQAQLWTDGVSHYYTEDSELILKLLTSDEWNRADKNSIDWDGWTPVTSEWYDEKAAESHLIRPRLDSFAHYQIESEKAETPEAPVVPIQGKSGYDALLRNYYHMIETQDFTGMIGNEGTYGLSPNAYSYLWICGNVEERILLSETGYALYDLNGDGIEELAVGVIFEDGSLSMYDLYTIYDGRIIHLAASGQRDSFSIGTQGEVIESGSSGAFNGTTAYYRIENGMFTITDMFKFYKDTWNHLEHIGTNAESWERVTEEEYNAGIASHEKLTLNAVPFTEFREESYALSDLIALQKYLLGIVSPVASDVNRDGAVDVFDLALMKRQLLNSEKPVS